MSRRRRSRLTLTLRNPRRSRSRSRSLSRTRSRSRSRSGSRSLSLRSLTRPATIAGVAKDASVGAVGYLGVNALRVVEGPLLDPLSARAGAASIFVEYGAKLVNAIASSRIAGAVSKKAAAPVLAGGLLNFGVSLVLDVAGHLGSAGQEIKRYAAGVSDYTLAYNLGTAMDPHAPKQGLSNFLLAGGGNVMPNSPVGEQTYPGDGSVY